MRGLNAIEMDRRCVVYFQSIMILVVSNDVLSASVVAVDVHPEGVPIFSRFVAHWAPDWPCARVNVPDVDPEAACTREQFPTVWTGQAAPA